MDAANRSNVCITDDKVIKLNYTWTIKNFSFHLDRRPLYSPEFQSNSADDNLRWQLTLFQNDLRCRLKFVNDKQEINRDFLTKTNFTLATVTPRQVICEKKRNIVFNTNSSIFNQIEIATKIERSQYEKYFKLDDTLEIYCEISYMFDSKDVLPDGQDVIIPASCLGDDLKQLYVGHAHSDVVLRVGKRDIFAHKAILAARSPVFRAMFDHRRPAQQERKRFNMTGIKYDVMKDLVMFIYTGDVSKPILLAKDLLAAADKYALDRLKAICEKALGSNLDADKATGLLGFADRYRAEQLKKACLSFIRCHLAEVKKSGSWKELARNPEEAAGLLSNLFKT